MNESNKQAKFNINRNSWDIENIITITIKYDDDDIHNDKRISSQYDETEIYILEMKIIHLFHHHIIINIY